MAERLSQEALSKLERLSLVADPPPWRAMIEGRDHASGDSFIQVGEDDDRGEDIYVSRDSGAAIAADLEMIAAARNAVPLLVAEVKHLQSELIELRRALTEPPEMLDDELS